MCSRISLSVRNLSFTHVRLATLISLYGIQGIISSPATRLIPSHFVRPVNADINTHILQHIRTMTGGAHSVHAA